MTMVEEVNLMSNHNHKSKEKYSLNQRILIPAVFILFVCCAVLLRISFINCYAWRNEWNAILQRGGMNEELASIFRKAITWCKKNSQIMYAIGICYLNEQEKLWEISVFLNIPAHLTRRRRHTLTFTLNLSLIMIIFIQ